MLPMTEDLRRCGSALSPLCDVTRDVARVVEESPLAEACDPLSTGPLQSHMGVESDKACTSAFWLLKVSQL